MNPSPQMHPSEETIERYVRGSYQTTNSTLLRSTC